LILVLTGLLAGCNAKQKPEEKVLKDQIATLDKLTEIYDKISDKDTFGSAQPLLKIYLEKLGRQKEEFDAFPADRKEAAMKVEGENVELANARLTMVKDKMRNLVFGKLEGPQKKGPVLKGPPEKSSPPEKDSPEK
jgi:hypothetical protein